MRTKHLLFAAVAAMSMLTACEKYNDSEIRENITSIDNRLTALEGKVTTLEGAMAALKTVVDKNYSITGFEKTDVGYKLTFTTGETLELLNGEKGDKGEQGIQGEKGDTGDSFFKSVTQEGGNIKIVMNDTNNTTYNIPCTAISIGADLTVNAIEVESGKASEIAINIPDGIEVASVTATVTYSNGVASNTATRAASITEWATTVAKDFKKVIVEVPATAKGNALLQVIVTKANSEGYTAFKALTIKSKMTASFEPSDASVKVKKGSDDVWGSSLAWARSDTRAALNPGDEDFTFAFSVGDKVTVTNSEISSTQNPFYTFTLGADNKFTSEDAKPTAEPATWTAYFPSNQISLAGQSGKLEDLAKYYMFVGTENGITGNESPYFKMDAKCAVLVINNQAGSIDINVKSDATNWVAVIDGSGVGCQEQKVSLLTVTATGTYYVVVPAGVQLAIKNGGTEIKATKAAGLTAGCYYDITLN